MIIPRKHVVPARIQRVETTSSIQRDDLLAVEEPLAIRLTFQLNNKTITKDLSITMRTPGEDFELAAGFLLCEGIVKAREDIREISYCVGPDKSRQEYNSVNVALRPGLEVDVERLTRHFYASSSCGVCGKASMDAVKAQGCPSLLDGKPIADRRIICNLPDALRKAQSGFNKTGGLHAAALFSPLGDLISLKEDVGRHNALDKLAGEQFLAGHTPLNDFILMVSGRTSFEIVQKAAMTGIPIVVGVGAPSSLAVDTAREFGMTLLGFVRTAGFNLYTGGERILQ